MDFIESDSDEEGKASGVDVNSFTPEEIEATKESILALKAEGNAFFTAADHDNALIKYTVSLPVLPWAIGFH